MGNDPGFLKMMAKLGTFFRNDSLITGDAPSTLGQHPDADRRADEEAGILEQARSPVRGDQEKAQKLFQSQTNPMAKAMRGEE